MCIITMYMVFYVQLPREIARRFTCVFVEKKCDLLNYTREHPRTTSHSSNTGTKTEFAENDVKSHVMDIVVFLFAVKLYSPLIGCKYHM